MKYVSIDRLLPYEFIEYSQDIFQKKFVTLVSFVMLILLYYCSLLSNQCITEK